MPGQLALTANQLDQLQLFPNCPLGSWVEPAAANESGQEENREMTCVTRKLMRPPFEERTRKQFSNTFQT